MKTSEWLANQDLKTEESKDVKSSSDTVGDYKKARQTQAKKLTTKKSVWERIFTGSI